VVNYIPKLGYVIHESIITNSEDASITMGFELEMNIKKSKFVKNPTEEEIKETEETLLKDAYRNLYLNIYIELIAINAEAAQFYPQSQQKRLGELINIIGKYL